MPIQSMRIISKDLRWFEDRGNIADIHAPGLLSRSIRLPLIVGTKCKPPENQ